MISLKKFSFRLMALEIDEKEFLNMLKTFPLVKEFELIVNDVFILTENMLTTLLS